MRYTVLIVGSGGREHALAWSLARSRQVDHVFIAPGNAGTQAVGTNIAISVEDIPALLNFAQEREVNLTIVGPEAPLAAGIVDAFQAWGLRVFGPTQAAARLESSKAFAKSFMVEHSIPTAAYAAFTDYEEAMEYVAALKGPCVVKADGLAAGKGVIMCDTTEQAQAALKVMMQDRAFGESGSTVVIEERLTGPEISILAFCDGKTVVPMPPARDHKRAFDGDMGPNTGGMGVYAPLPDISSDFRDEIRRSVLQPVVSGMARRGTPYVGVLYAGLMLTPDGLRVLEFNCRFGDPETEAILPLLESDLFEIFMACTEQQLGKIGVHWRPGACATVVLAAPGYPEAYPKGLPITGVDEANAHDEVVVFHAGTARNKGQLVTSGGRVLAVSATGGDLEAALKRAYSAVETIHFDGMHYRRDIGKVNQNP
jgi:phosphoribosylamine---glycine ligase